MVEAEKLCWLWDRLDGLRASKSLMVMSWFLLLVKWLVVYLFLVGDLLKQCQNLRKPEADEAGEGS